MTCEELVGRFVGDAEEAPLVSMDLENECDAGAPASCAALGFFLLDGEDVPHEPERAARLLEGACDHGWVDACTRAGMHLAEGEGSPERDVRAVHALGRACDAARGDACTRLGDLARVGRGGPRDVDASLAAYRRGCEAGSDLACRRVADHHMGTGDRAALVELYRSMCDGDRPHGCTLLADVFARGTDAAEQEQIGALLDRGCQGGDVDGCARLGVALARGDFAIPPDAGRARQTLESACASGNADACGELGSLVERGIGARASAARATEIYEQACASRGGVACFQLGLRVRDAPGYRDDARAVELFRMACDSGEVERACGSLAAAYDMGRGVPQDRAAAIPLYHRACDGGHASSCVRLAELVSAGDGADADGERAEAFSHRACELEPDAERCPARSIAPLAYTVRVRESRGRGAPRLGSSCQVVVDATIDGGHCRLRVQCGGRGVYGSHEDAWARCSLEGTDVVARDLETTPFDGSPQLVFDSTAHRLAIGDVGPRPRSTYFVADSGD